MTKLPERNILDGSKQPKTTTGEMKNALGKLRDYLNELLGEDSTDKEAARLALGIDLSEWNETLSGMKTVLSGKADQNALQQLQEQMKQRVPVGSVHYFAMAEPPEGYLKADGSAVERTVYPELYAAIGTTFGEGDGSTTFNLPNLMGRFAEGSTTPGTVKEAGLPNVTGNFGTCVPFYHTEYASGAFRGITVAPSSGDATDGGTRYTGTVYGYTINASYSSPIYGRSSTVQPPSVTLLPCIRALNG